MNDKEPYRATKLWNDVIAAFHSGMPLKKHRRRMQTFNDCFTATEAVTWLHYFLLNNSNFGPNVTRLQTVNLLQKFLKCHVIESVMMKSKKKEFLDDSHLYKFSSMLSHSKPSALCLVQSPLVKKSKFAKEKLNNAELLPKSTNLQKENFPQCHLVEKKLSANEIKAIYEKVTINRLETLLPHIVFEELINSKLIDGNLIKYNVSRLSKTGVVCLIDKTDDIPHWVISAMKCLANWPNASGSGSCLPNYPGFEKDVFKVVRDFFINPQVPLISESITSLLLNMFSHFVQDFESSRSSKASRRSKAKLSNSEHSSRISHSFSSDVKTSTPLANDSSFKCSSPNLHETLEGKLLLDDPEVMWEYPSEVYFETDFATTQPITRIISSQNTPRSRNGSQASSIGSIESVSTISVCSTNQRFLALNDRDYRSRAPLKAWSSNLYLQDEIKESPQWSKTDLSHIGVAEGASLKPCKGSENLCNSFSYPSEPLVYMCEVNDLNTSNISSKTITESMENIEIADLGPPQDSCHFFQTKNSNAYSSPSEQVSKCNNQSHKYEAEFIKENIFSEDLKSSFQLILLFMPSANRRQLHLLLRLLNKILKNGKFTVDASISMRQFLLETFSPAIIQSEDLPSKSLLLVVAFLMDYSELIFEPPTGLKEEAVEVCRYSSGRIRFTVDDTCSLTYCEMVSKQQYEEQKISSSVHALRGLLNSILNDKTMPEKEKKKKLKQFKNSHPDIYMMQFPEKTAPNTKSKSSFFNRLVNLRM